MQAVAPAIAAAVHGVGGHSLHRPTLVVAAETATALAAARVAPRRAWIGSPSGASFEFAGLAIVNACVGQLLQAPKTIRLCQRDRLMDSGDDVLGRRWFRQILVSPGGQP